MAKDLAKALGDLQEDEAIAITQEKLDANEDAMAILAEAGKGMDVVGTRFSKGEYFIPDLVYSGEILRRINELVKPKLTAGTSQKKEGKVIIATVAGDIHDIGKDILVFMLDVAGFEVYDMGVDVPIQQIVDKVKETGATVLGLSGFLTLAYDARKETIEALKAAGLRDKLKIMIGGGQ
ncbi:MAG: cobalamin-dependent protein, partial [Candidatus Omnitrophica bacterium]|nr:cobalamin-dependent protein [Candidatus Omnitrophota bacterium]